MTHSALKKQSAAALVLAACLTASTGTAHATASSTTWTPMTLDIQPYGILRIGVDNYFTVFRKATDGSGTFPTDTGLEIGILPYERFQMEIGFDLLEPSDDPLYFNFKAGAPEGALFKGAPALQLGIFNVGTKSGVTNYNIVHLVVGKSIPRFGRISVGPYVGNEDVLVDAQGKKENSGFMVAYDRAFGAVEDAAGNTFNRWIFAVDWASGNNALGGGMAGLYYYFNKDISLLMGPTWFNEEAINGQWKWSVQLDINKNWFAK